MARLVASDGDMVRNVTHSFNRFRLVCLNPRRAGIRPRLITAGDEAFVVPTATDCPIRLGQSVGRRPALGRDPAPQERREYPGRAALNLRRLATTPRPHTSCSTISQRTKDPQDPTVGRTKQRRTLSHSDLRRLGEAGRGMVRLAPHLHHGQLESPQPHRRCPRAPVLPALAQRPRPSTQRPVGPRCERAHLRGRMPTTLKTAQHLGRLNYRPTFVDSALANEWPVDQL